MAEPLGGIVQGNVVVAAGQNSIQEQRVDVGLEVPAVHLHRELIPQDQGNGEGVVLVVIFLVALGGQNHLFQADEVLVGDGQGHVGDDLHPLSDHLLPAGTPDGLIVIVAVGTDHPVDH